ncbi:hypothetical protein Bca52824_053543 [Brassica carinata]|uniref:Uncharacterized protein n=1 Tax=Brassica carinata TaxID=52824 RepID=A0A8X7R422_BRACI|nr:hypothetical protein Bca52824_053543 [Brassica carinata]
MDRDAYYSQRWLRSAVVVRSQHTEGSVYGSDQFLQDTGYWIGCVLGRVGLAVSERFLKLSGGFECVVGSSERTRKHAANLYGRVPCTDWINSVWMRGAGSSGVIRDWFWGAIKAGVLSVLDGWLEPKPSLFVYLGHVGMVG